MSYHWQAIQPVDQQAQKLAQIVLDQKTKPQGSLGQIERVAVLLASVLGEGIRNVQPCVAVFAADHGIAEAGVSAFPQEVTCQMVNNFVAGGGAVNVFARVVDAQFLIVDVGVKGELAEHENLLSRPVAKGTKNFANFSAMTTAQCLAAMDAGREAVDLLWERGCNLFAGGEMGIGNTTSASAIMHVLTGISAECCVGRGTGVPSAVVAHKAQLIEAACERHFSGRPADPLHILACVGGFEIAALAGAYLQAAHRGMVVVVDGFIATSAFLVAGKLEPFMLDYAIFAHQSGELGHACLLEYMGVTPLLNLQMRLGEGSGAVLALPLIQAAAKIYNEMASFTSAGVSEKSSE